MKICAGKIGTRSEVQIFRVFTFWGSACLLPLGMIRGTREAKTQVRTDTSQSEL